MWACLSQLKQPPLGADVVRMSSSVPAHERVGVTRVKIATDVWIRNLNQTVGCGAAGVAVAGFWAWMGFHFVIFHHSQVPATTASKVGAAAFLLSLAVLFLWCGIRQLRAGLWISRERVVVRGMLRTRIIDPDEATGFVAGTRLAPCPLLHRKHGRPFAVTALSRSGILKSSNARFLRQVGPVCDELNVLLATVQSGDHKHEEPPGVEVTSEHARENYRVLRSLTLAYAAVFIVISGAVVALAPSPTVAIFVSALSLVNTVGTYVVLRSQKRDVDHGERARSADGDPTP
jgi:hypothetical protein